MIDDKQGLGNCLSGRGQVSSGNGKNMIASTASLTKSTKTNSLANIGRENFNSQGNPSSNTNMLLGLNSNNQQLIGAEFWVR